MSAMLALNQVCQVLITHSFEPHKLDKSWLGAWEILQATVALGSLDRPLPIARDLFSQLNFDMLHQILFRLVQRLMYNRASEVINCLVTWHGVVDKKHHLQI